MAAHRLTATKIDKYKPSTNDEILSDGNGLCLRYRTGRTGSRSRVWMYTYRSGTASIYLTLGEHDASLPDVQAAIYKLTPGARLTLENARKIALELGDWRKRGLDPKGFLQGEIDRRATEAKVKAEAEATARKQAELENLSVQDLLEAWLQDGVRRKDGNAELVRSFAADILPAIGKKPVRLLTEHDLRGVLRAMAGRGVNRAAVVMRNNLTQMFSWAEKRQPWRKLLVEGNPMDLIEIEKIVSRDYKLRSVRDRVLSANEIRELGDIFARMQANYDTAANKRIAVQPVEETLRHAVWIMLSTLCRVGELSMARWEHIDFPAGTWFLPQENVKGNVNDFTVMLSDFALGQFRQLHSLTGQTPWCFPARNREGHVCVKSLSKQVGDRQAMFKKGKDGNPRQPMQHRRHDNSLVVADGEKGAWTPHDLRRTGATMMQGLGIELDIIDRCQNHVLAGSKVRRAYLHHEYINEKREAWRLLGDKLSSILAAPANIVSIHRMV